jgi:hypothetical protein
MSVDFTAMENELIAERANIETMLAAIQKVRGNGHIPRGPGRPRLTAITAMGRSVGRPTERKKRKMTKAGRAAISLAQRKRWAKIKSLRVHAPSKRSAKTVKSRGIAAVETAA